jgi:hypothetical protein
MDVGATSKLRYNQNGMIMLESEMEPEFQFLNMIFEIPVNTGIDNFLCFLKREPDLCSGKSSFGFLIYYSMQRKTISSFKK